MAKHSLPRGKPRKYSQDQARFCFDLRAQEYSWGKIAELTAIPVGSVRSLVDWHQKRCAEFNEKAAPREEAALGEKDTDAGSILPPAGMGSETLREGEEA